MKIFIESWDLWRAGDEYAVMPDLSFLPSRMKRRMSQLSRMIVEVGHSLIGEADIDDVVFASRYGELKRQLQITEGIIDSGEVSPAAFSQSVFNTPVALVSLHEKITGVTRAVYGGNESLSKGLMQAVLLASGNKSGKALFLYGDEMIPETYKELGGEDLMPIALGMLLSVAEPEKSGSPEIDLEGVSDDLKQSITCVEDLCLWLEIPYKTAPFSLVGDSYRLTLSKGSA